MFLSFKTKTNKQDHTQTVKPFLPSLLPFHGKGATKLWLPSRKVLSKQNSWGYGSVVEHLTAKQNSYRHPSEPDATRNETENPPLVRIAVPRGLYTGGSFWDTLHPLPGEFSLQKFCPFHPSE